MENQNSELTQEEIAQLFCALNEKNITAESLLEEIQPLIENYFIGNFIKREEGIELAFLNGQRFMLSVRAV